MDRAEVAQIVRDELERSTLGVLIRALGGRVLYGNGTPAGVVSAPVGTLWLRLDGGATTTLYVKESGTSTAGWVAK